MSLMIFSSSWIRFPVSRSQEEEEEEEEVPSHGSRSTTTITTTTTHHHHHRSKRERESSLTLFLWRTRVTKDLRFCEASCVIKNAHREVLEYSIYSSLSLSLSLSFSIVRDKQKYGAPGRALRVPGHHLPAVRPKSRL